MLYSRVPVVWGGKYDTLMSIKDIIVVEDDHSMSR